MLILALDSAIGGGAALVAPDPDRAGGAAYRPLIETRLAEDQDPAAALPALVRDMVRAGRRTPARVVVCSGPGSFTGLRAGLALAAGLALGWGVPAIGVGLFAALAAELAPAGPGPLWVASRARPGRVFLARVVMGHPDPPAGVMLSDLPAAPEGLRLAGDAAALVAERIGGVDLGRARPDLSVLAWLAEGRAAAPLLPLYVDPPEARLPGLAGPASP